MKFLATCCALSAILLVPTPILAAEQLQNIPREPEVYIEHPQPVIILPDGTRSDATLPEGFRRQADGSLVLPDGVVVYPNGHFTLPAGVPSWQYTRREDGTVVTPYGTIRFPGNRTFVEPEPIRRPAPVVQPRPATTPEPPAPGQPQARNPEQHKARQAERRMEEMPSPSGQEAPGTPSVQLWQMLPLTNVPDAQEPTTAQAPQKPRQVADAGTPKPDTKPQRKAEKPEKTPPKPPTEKPRSPKGANLQIPPAAPAQKDLAFLDGCWRSDPVTGGTWDNPHMPRTSAVAEMCFDTHGNGRITVRDGSLVCRGGARASFRGKNLIIDSDNAKCPPNSRQIKNFTLRHWKCQGSGRATQCFLLSINPSGRHEVNVFRTHLKRSR